ncbi:hypothetical protein OUZ56_031471 [Daphnia magna]|uniref:Uncharacterized protein n=1 Tax=Daphnia magna TaxID=35525 RepID=A0ABQ9ZUB9_9CRUS|nr:hypothetical protein OUZ56_031471 [Daphnia magna]
MTLLAPSQCALATPPSAAIRNRHLFVYPQIMAGLLAFTYHKLPRCYLAVENVRLLVFTDEEAKQTKQPGFLNS